MDRKVIVSLISLIDPFFVVQSGCVLFPGWGQCLIVSGHSFLGCAAIQLFRLGGLIGFLCVRIGCCSCLLVVVVVGSGFLIRIGLGVCGCLGMAPVLGLVGLFVWNSSREGYMF